MRSSGYIENDIPFVFFPKKLILLLKRDPQICRLFPPFIPRFTNAGRLIYHPG
jgi:hypothetical protein